jgi:hypothetical protein
MKELLRYCTSGSCGSLVSKWLDLIYNRTWSITHGKYSLDEQSRTQSSITKIQRASGWELRNLDPHSFKLSFILCASQLKCCAHEALRSATRMDYVDYCKHLKGCRNSSPSTCSSFFLPHSTLSINPKLVIFIVSYKTG